ncbi:MAG: zinc ribbon domain-containing protein [Atopobiaceae bacterium]|nr:zinc ribbon domain-containing protein [Atopobiaceae bacterium]
MKLVAFVCPSCGAKLEIDSECKQAFCGYCGAQLHIDDEVHRVEHAVSYDNAEEAGYLFEKGRQRVMTEAPVQSHVQPATKPKKKTSIVVWVLGWIFIFPIPLAVLLLRKKSVKPAVKYAIIAIAWIVYLGWVFLPSSKNKTKDTSSETVATQSEAEPAIEDESADGDESVAEEEAAAEQTTEDEKSDAANSDAILLEAGVSNEYSSVKIEGEGTGLEEHNVIFDVPAGKYEAKNVGRYMAQINVYSHEEVQQGEYLEPADAKVTMLDVGESKEVEIPEGYYIFIVEPDRIELTPK